MAMATATAPPSTASSSRPSPRLGLAAPPVCRLGVVVAPAEEAAFDPPWVGVITVMSVTVLTCPFGSVVACLRVEVSRGAVVVGVVVVDITDVVLVEDVDVVSVVGGGVVVLVVEGIVVLVSMDDDAAVLVVVEVLITGGGVLVLVVEGACGVLVVLVLVVVLVATGGGTVGVADVGGAVVVGAVVVAGVVEIEVELVLSMPVCRLASFNRRDARRAFSLCRASSALALV
jgi:hypothetical protein